MNLDTLGFIKPAPDRKPVAARPVIGDWNADISQMTADEMDAHSAALFA